MTKNSLHWPVRAAIALSALLAAIACRRDPSPSENEPPVTNSAPAPGVAAADPTRVEVTADGFQPPRLELGDSRRVVFRRTTDATCATAVVFPELRIEKPLPLNVDVAIDLPPSAKGELGFQCGMGMYKSKVVVQ